MFVQFHRDWRQFTAKRVWNLPDGMANEIVRRGLAHVVDSDQQKSDAPRKRGSKPKES